MRSIYSQAALALLLGAVLLAVVVNAQQLADSPRLIEMPPKSGKYLILCKEAYDGDTVDFYWLVPDKARLYGINAPELRGESAEAGQRSKAYLTTILPVGPTPAIVHDREKFGRALLDVLDHRGKSLSEIMVDKGHAKPWDGKGARP